MADMLGSLLGGGGSSKRKAAAAAQANRDSADIAAARQRQDAQTGESDQDRQLGRILRVGRGRRLLERAQVGQDTIG